MSLYDGIHSLLAKPSRVVLEEGGVLVLRIEQCNEADRDALQAFVVRDKASDAENYQAYFDEIRAYPLFKRSNPLLAIRFVAKQHGLSPEDLAVAFNKAAD